MKKLMMIFCVFLLLSGCSNNASETKNEKQVTCKLEENEQAGVEATYTYDDEGNITKIHNVSFIQFTEEELVGTSLDKFYQLYQEKFKEAEGVSGVKVEITKDESKNRIHMVADVQIDSYNLEEDIMNVANDGEMDNIKDLVALYEAMDIYECGEVK